MSESDAAHGGEVDREWKFEVGQVAQRHDVRREGMMEAATKEYRVERRLLNADDLEDEPSRFYKVEKEEGGTHLFNAEALEVNYEPVPEEESRIWPKEGGYFD